MPTDRHDARPPDQSLEALVSPWRVGGKVARNIYAVMPAGDLLIGQMDTGQLARECVYRHNDAHGFA